MGGFLQHPHERFPAYFDTAFWKMYPYLVRTLFLFCRSQVDWTCSSLAWLQQLCLGRHS
jgi:hypothetical protein